MPARQPAPTLNAVVSVRAVHVDCPACKAALYEPATPHDPVPWGKTETCWDCGATVKLPRSPFR
jgi:hypothetical protein